MIKKLLVFTSALFFYTLSWSVYAVVIDFDSLETPTGGILSINSPYTEDGFQISGNPLNYFSQDDDNYAGSAGLLVAADSGVATLSNLISGTTFTLDSIDLSYVDPHGIRNSFSFLGQLFGGGTVTQNFTPTGFGFAQFNFNSTFTNLTSVSWAQGAGGSIVGHQFDNIVINSSVPLPVPEPSTYLLIALGFAGIGFARKKKQN